MSNNTTEFIYREQAAGFSLRISDSQEQFLLVPFYDKGHNNEQAVNNNNNNQPTTKNFRS